MSKLSHCQGFFLAFQPEIENLCHGCWIDFHSAQGLPSVNRPIQIIRGPSDPCTKTAARGIPSHTYQVPPLHPLPTHGFCIEPVAMNIHAKAFIKSTNVQTFITFSSLNAPNSPWKLPLASAFQPECSSSMTKTQASAGYGGRLS